MTSLSVLLDACVLFPFRLCDALLLLAEKELYRVHFSQQILDEATRNRVKRGKMTEKQAKVFQQRIIEYFPDALVDVPPGLADVMTNHEGDRHVLAAAVVAKVDLIVTSNLKHFPATSLVPWNIEVQHPDDFLNNLCDLHGDEILYSCIEELVVPYKKPPMTALDLLKRFEEERPKFVARIMMYRYGEVVTSVARKYRQIMAGTNDLCYTGQYYQICDGNGTLTVTEKETYREVIRASSEQMSGNILTKDVEMFIKAAKEIENAPAKEALKS
ncbi:MAG: PIN domain-containing protein [Myxacorys californica WJT36-NPBG1]|nr:PIN domain-containing protein [Myxacorys californica WJT36-NPBG1]